MKRNTACLFLFGSLLSISGMAQTKKDSIQAGRNYMIDEVVVTGTRNTIAKSKNSRPKNKMCH